MEEEEDKIYKILNDEDADYDDLYDLADTLDVCMDGLNEIPEMKERIKMYLAKNEYGNSKTLISKALKVARKEDKHKRQMMVGILKEFQKIMYDYRVTADCGSQYRRGTEVIEELLKTEETSKDLHRELQAHIKLLERGECLFVVAGETSAGKSSLLNLLFGQDLLPYKTGSSTSVITRISYGKKLCCEIHYKNGKIEEHKDIDIDYVQNKLWDALMVSEEERRLTETEIKEVRFRVPSDILECGIVIVDSPGIGENEAMDGIIAEFVKSNIVTGYIYVIKSDNAGGVDEERLLGLLKIVIDAQKKVQEENVQIFEPKSAMFVCNRWDLVKVDEETKVFDNAVNTLSGCWPNLSKSQVIKIKTKHAQDESKIDPDFVPELYRIFLERLRDVYISATDNRLQQTYKWLSKVFKRSSHHLRTVLTQVELSHRDMQDRMVTIKDKLKILKSKSDEVIENLHGHAEKATTDICDAFRNELTSPHCKTNLTNWLKEELPPLSPSGWPMTKVNLQWKLAERTIKLIEDWELENHYIAEVEEKVLNSIKFELNLLEDEIESIEGEIAPQTSASRRESIRQSITNPFQLMKAKSRYSICNDTSPLPLKLVSRVLHPVQSLVGNFKKPKIIDKMVLASKERAYRDNPKKVMQERGQKFLNNLIHDKSEGNMLGMMMSNLMERSTTQISAIERNIPALIKSNEQLLDHVLACRSDAEESKNLYDGMKKRMEATEKKQKQFEQGYISVKTYRDFEVDSKDKKRSLPFRISDMFRVSSKRSSSGSDCGEASRGLWTALQHGRCKGTPITVKMYLPTSGVETTYIEVAYLRFLNHQHLAKFMGIHYSDAPPPVFLYQDRLQSVNERRICSPLTAKSETFTIIEQTMQGLAYLHRKGMVHMELSADTVTVDSTGSVRLTGGCLPRKFVPPDNSAELAGDFVYLRPNVLTGQEYSPAADVYAFGLLIYELLLNAKSFVDQRGWKFTEFQSQLDPKAMFAKEEKLGHLSSETIQLIKNCLDVTSEGDLSIKDLHQAVGPIQQEKVIQPECGRQRSVHDEPRTLN